jgi:flavodoxin
LKLSTNVIDLSLIKDEALPKSGVLIFISSTWSGGTIPESSIPFMNWLKDTSYDFRVSKDYLSNVQFAVFGLGGKVYGEHYGRVVS